MKISKTDKQLAQRDVKHNLGAELLQTMITVLNARLADSFKMEVEFSDHTHGVFDAGAYLASHSGPLLDKLHDAAYFQRFFIDAGALCWPNGLELSPARVHELSVIDATARA